MDTHIFRPFLRKRRGGATANQIFPEELIFKLRGSGMSDPRLEIEKIHGKQNGLNN